LATETVENYLKAIHTLCRASPTGEAGMTRLGATVGVTTGTATTMVKKLARAKLARYERFGGVTLTPKGTRAAVDILRRHRLLETFLVEALKLDWSIVHAEAERLEHAVSPVVLEALDALLGHPSVDPHGDPIPDAAGRIREPAGKPLSDSPSGASLRITRIADQDEQFLLFVARHGLKPGKRVVVLAVDVAAQAITVQAGHAPVTLALAVAAKIMVERAPA
jgi:DtxR family transcriptional regulator, Mn-dependent transcriptional regulator